MASNTFNVGKDVTVIYMGAFGRVEFSHVVSWESKPVIKTVKVDPLNSPPIARDLPGGWDFTFSIERNGPAADSLQALKETAYWNGITIPAETMYAYISEPDGSQSVWQYNNCTSHLADAGTWKQESAVQQKVNGFSSQRVQVS